MTDIPTVRGGTIRRLVKPGILVLGVIGLVIAIREAAADTGGVQLPGLPTLLVALVAVRTGLWCSARCWSELVGPDADRAHVMKAFYDSQLVKYLPAGGFVQAASQVALTTSASTPLASATFAFVLQAVATVSAGFALGAVLVVAGDVDLWVRLVGAAAAGAGALLIYRGTLQFALRHARRLTRRFTVPLELPAQSTLNRCFAWSVANHTLQATSFVLLLRASDASVPIAAIIGAYVLAWTIGFLALPLPSGIGVREAILVAVVPMASTADVLTASLAQRVVTVVGEALAAAAIRATVHWTRRRKEAGG